MFGTISFGFTGTPLDGQLIRRGRPRMALAVERVFAEYVIDYVPMAEIVRRLNAPGRPAPAQVARPNLDAHRRPPAAG